MGLFASKYTNILGDGEVAGRSPDAEGDFYHITDAEADHNYWQERMCDNILAMTTTPTNEFLILYGGVVSDSGSGQIDISAGAAIGKNSDGEKRIIAMPALTNIALPSGWNNGRPIWVIARHDFKLSAATRAHRAGISYHYQLEDTYFGDSNGDASTGTDDLFTDSDPVATDTILGKFTMTGTTYADLSVRSQTLDQDAKNRLYPVGSFYVQYPAVASNDVATAFPTAQRPAMLFGGTWVEQFATDNVFFKTGNVNGQARTNGLSLDQMQGHYVTGALNGGTGATTAMYDGGCIMGSTAYNTDIRVASYLANSGYGDIRQGYFNEPRNRLMKLWKRTVL